MLIETMDGASLRAEIDALSQMLHLAVADGANIGFVKPFTQDDAAHFWQTQIVPLVERSQSIMFAARVEGAIVGTVQLGLPVMPNQQHKADVAKMMVHPGFRRRGIAAALLTALIDAAQERGFRILMLDTRTGDPAQSLYARFGFERAGEIPGYAMNPEDPSTLDPTTYMYKWLT